MISFFSIYAYDLFEDFLRLKLSIALGYVDAFCMPACAHQPAAMSVWFEYKVGHPVPVSLGVQNMDHILYKIDYFVKPLFSFSYIVDKPTWLSIFVSMIIVSILNHLLVPKTSFLNNFWFHCMSCLRPIKFYQKGKDRILTSLWCLFMVTVYMNYYAGEYYSTVTSSPTPKIIDSWDDLVQIAEKVEKIVAPTVHTTFNILSKEEQQKITSEHINIDYPHRDILIKNLELKQADTYDGEKCELFAKAEEGSWAVLSSKTNIDYNTQQCCGGRFRDTLHVSKFGGEAQPMFLTLTNVASQFDGLFANT